MHAASELRRFTVDEYHRMIALGIVGPNEHVELVDGSLVMTPPHGGPHARVLERLSVLLFRAAGDAYVPRCQLPLTLRPESEPEPDLSLVAADTERAPHPVTAALIIEVADTTLRHDARVKLPLYARHAVPEVWIVDVAARAVVVHRAPLPAEARYGDITTHGPGATVRPLALPSLAVDIDALFAP